MTGLVKKIDQQVDATAGKAARPVGAGGLDQQLRGMAEKEGLKRVSLCIGAPPDDYEVSKKADVTVVIYKVGKRRDEKVTANFALRECELDAAKIDAIVKAFADALPK